MSEQINNGNISEQQIAHWKAQYGAESVKEIVVPLEDDKIVDKEIKGTNDEITFEKVVIPCASFVAGYFRKPDLKVIAAASVFVDTDPVKAGIIQMENCFLGGADEFKTNDEVKVSAMKALNQMFRVRQAVIKNV